MDCRYNIFPFTNKPLLFTRCVLNVRGYVRLTTKGGFPLRRKSPQTHGASYLVPSGRVGGVGRNDFCVAAIPCGMHGRNRIPPIADRRSEFQGAAPPRNTCPHVKCCSRTDRPRIGTDWWSQFRRNEASKQHRGCLHMHTSDPEGATGILGESCPHRSLVQPGPRWPECHRDWVPGQTEAHGNTIDGSDGS